MKTKAIILQRGKGKTTELINLSAKTGEYIVCHSHSVKHIADAAKSMGLQIPYPLSYHEFIEGRYYGKGVKGVLIDEIGSLLREISRVPVSAITLSPEDV